MSLFRINFELIYLKYILQMKRFFTFTLLLSFVSLALLSFPISQTKGEEEVYPGINEEDAGKFSDFEILSPKYGDVFSFEEDIDIQWKNKDTQKEYVYYVYIYFLEGQFHMGSTFTLTQDDGATIRPIEKGVVALQVYLFDKEFYWTEQRSEHTYVSEILVLGIGMDIPEYWYKRFYKEKEIEEPVTIEIPKEIVEGIEEEKPIVVKPKEVEAKKVKIPSIEVVNEPDMYDWNFPQQQDVKGVGRKSTKCRYKYLQRYNQATKIECTIPDLENLSSEIVQKETVRDILVKGNIFRDMEIVVDVYVCERNIFKPKTWFGCEEKYLETKYLNIHPYIHMNILLDDKAYSPLAYYLNVNDFTLLSQISKVNEVKKVQLDYSSFFRIQEYNVFENFKKTYDVPILEQDKNDSSKPFSFPFQSAVGVSQWHGYTQYQKPHTGIDFSVAKKETLAIGSGLVVGKGWDSYYGKCLSGGNYLTVKQDNGMHTVYFHLDESFVNVGENVKKNQVIARTGNSGFWNCQPLAYHLHFELRTKRLQSTHVNPVEYIDQDWSKVLTVGYKQNPGRLSGDNPHPGS